MNNDTVTIRVRQVFGKKEYFPTIAFVILGDDLIVTATLTQKLERDHGWRPEIVKAMLQHVTTVEWHEWELEQDIACREWTLVGRRRLLGVRVRAADLTAEPLDMPLQKLEFEGAP